MNKDIYSAVEGSIKAVQQLLDPKGLAFIEKAAHLIADCFKQGNKVIIAGNGGSLCDAMHFAEELTGQFRSFRQALPAIALSEPGHITCTANDMGYDRIFSRGVEAYGKPGDIFIGLTTSGNSPNIIKAFHEAMRRNLSTISFLGKDGGALKGVADLELVIAGSTSDRIQEAHMTAIHVLIEMVESLLFSEEKIFVEG
jgi:D-sedoheptulose 7-phosphate isomerase